MMFFLLSALPAEHIRFSTTTSDSSKTLPVLRLLLPPAVNDAARCPTYFTPIYLQNHHFGVRCVHPSKATDFVPRQKGFSRDGTRFGAFCTIRASCCFQTRQEKSTLENRKAWH